MNSAFIVTGGAEFSFVDKTQKFLDTEAGVLLEHDFKFVNSGDEPLISKSYEGACSCTKITYPKEPVMPGKTGEIEVKYATNRISGFSKMITVTSKVAGAPKRIRIKGIVMKPEAKL